MSFLLLLFQLMTTPPVFASESREGAAEIVLEVGEIHRLPSSAPLQLEKSQAIKVKTDAKGTQLIAIKPGAAAYSQQGKRQTLSILSQKRMKTLKTLTRWTAIRPGLQVYTERGDVILAGELLQATDWTGLAENCPGCDYRAQLKFPDVMKSEVEESLEQRAKTLGVDAPALRFNPFAEWSVPSGGKGKALSDLAGRLGIEVIESTDAISVSPMIRTQIYVMEVRRDFSRKFGLQWPASATAQIIPPAGNISLSPLEFSAQALENQGYGRILASPTLLCRSGEEAEFLAGGEFPIKVANFHAQGVVWKRYGILLKVKPKADRFGRLNISLETEVSNIDNSRVVDGIPGLLTNRVLSHFDLKKSTLIALSGLIKNEEGKAVQGLPGLSQVPILGGLFGSQEFRENRTELVIFVKPELMEESGG